MQYVFLTYSGFVGYDIFFLRNIEIFCGLGILMFIISAPPPHHGLFPLQFKEQPITLTKKLEYYLEY